MTSSPALPPEELADVLSDLLPGKVGPDDDFYAVGGHSMLIVQVMRRLRRDGWHLDPRAFARDSRIRALARSATRT